ncbi:MAG: hypothetical protein B7Z73_10600 [Planctomycetia bacterium 21-64-5]|nr:MAG: hypothetical protein B7Z73_10600 [Planctomycetia bacterium 21-64-5]
MRRGMGEVAARRVEYASANSEVAHRRALLEAAERQLADVRATQAVACKCSLIDRIGTPYTGSRPLGPGRLMIAAVGTAGGLLAGLGIVILTMPVPVGGNVSRRPVHGNHEREDDHELAAGNGHSQATEAWKNRFASVP